MKESIWGYAILVLGILAVGIIWFFANTTRTDQHNYNLLKETTEAAMIDALDLASYRKDGTVRIEEEKFVENFIRRFAENADLSNEYYEIKIYDVNETPPKVSLKVSSAKDTNSTGEVVEFDIVNNIDAILETTYFAEIEPEEEEKEIPNTQNQSQKCQTRTISPSMKINCKRVGYAEYECSGGFSYSQLNYKTIKKVEILNTSYSLNTNAFRTKRIVFENVSMDVRGLDLILKYTIRGQNDSYDELNYIINKMKNKSIGHEIKIQGCY